MTKASNNIFELPGYDLKSGGEYTVSEISNLIRSSIEEAVGFIRVKGEISGLKIAPSGHVYFSLKDNTAVLSAICWKGVAQSLKYKPEEGLEVICAGSITTYAGQSKYQMMVQSINPTGMGALMVVLEKRKQQFIKEGLFDQKHKKPLPFIPKVIGVVTSLGGVVIRDIIHRINDRHHVHIIVWPVLVQGDASAAQVAQAVKGFNDLNEKPDLIIIARGGGSIEDLWSFNEEIVVRAVFESCVPVISAIGHESDTTLVDYVADVRAPTPTAAAEMAVPVRKELLLMLQELEHRQRSGAQKHLGYYAAILASLVHALPDLNAKINYYAQRLDEISIRLIEAFPNFSKHALARLNLIAAKIHSPASYILIFQNIVSSRSWRIQSTALKIIESKTHFLDMAAKLLDSYNYKNTLKRGYAIVKDAGGNLVKTGKSLNADQEISIEFADVVKTAKVK